METENLSVHSSAKKKENNEDQQQRSVRFELELKESNDKYFPEFSFKELLRTALVGEEKEKPLPVDNDEENEKIQALAKKFEEKYGPKQKIKKKRKASIQDLIDVTYGYDETDPFVDNSEAYDELIPCDWTTEHGGFYINQGGLNFRPLSGDESDGDDFKGVKKKKTPKKLKDPNKVKKVRESGEKEKKRKHSGTDKEKKPRKIRLISGEKEKKHKKKLSTNDSNNPSSSASLLMKMISTTSAVTALSQAVSPSSASSVSLTSIANTPAQSTEGSPQEKTTIKTETDLLATENSMNSQDCNVSSMTSVTNGLSSGKIDESFVPQLPSNLPLSVEACVQKLKIAANNGIDEGKCKFFNKDVNQLLLDIETKSRELGSKIRSGIYEYLAFYLPCTKETLLKRAKKLLLTDQAGRLREPMAKLKAAINKVMPEQIKAFEEEVRQHVEEQSKTSGVEEQSPEDKKKELFKSAMEVDDDTEKSDEVISPTDPSTPSNEEKTKKSLPRRKFVWNDELRELLSDVVSLRVKLFEMSKTRTTSAEEYLKEFFETEVKTLWPKGWMTSRILFKESKLVHNRVTSTQFKPKKVPGPKKQGDSLLLSESMDSTNQPNVPKEEVSTTLSTITTMTTITSTTTASPTPAMTTVTKTTSVTPSTSATPVVTTSSGTGTKTLPKLNPGALSMLKAKIIQVNSPSTLSKVNLLSQLTNKPASSGLQSTKTTTANSIPSTGNTPTVTMSSKLPSVALASPKPPSTETAVSMVTKSAVMTTMSTTPASVANSVPKPVEVKRESIESKGVSTKVESTIEKRPEHRMGSLTSNGLPQVQQQLQHHIQQKQLQQQQQIQQQQQQQMERQQLQQKQQQQQKQPHQQQQIHQQQQLHHQQQQKQQQQLHHQQSQQHQHVHQHLQQQHQQHPQQQQHQQHPQQQQQHQQHPQQQQQHQQHPQQQQQHQQHPQQQQQHQQHPQQHKQDHGHPIKSPVNSIGQMSNASGQYNQQSMHTTSMKPPYHHSPSTPTLQTPPTPPANPVIKNQPVTILDFADMMSSDSSDDAQEMLNSQMPQPTRFINKSPSPQKPKEPSMPAKGNTGVMSPQRHQTNPVYTSPSSLMRSPSQMTQARNNLQQQSNAVMANMMMSMSSSMSNLQNKFIDLNAASMMAQQRQQVGNNKTILDSITSPRMSMDMHSSSVPLSHPMISHQMSNPTQSVSGYMPNSLQQPTLSMLGHTNLPVKNTNPLSHLGMVPDGVPTSLMHMNRPLQQQQQQQVQQQAGMVMQPNPFNQGYNVPRSQGNSTIQMSQSPLLNSQNIFQDPPPSPYMPRFS